MAETEPAHLSDDEPSSSSEPIMVDTRPFHLSGDDPSSFSEPEEVLTNHMDLFWNIDFDKKIISGEVVLHLESIPSVRMQRILLDVSEITIHDVNVIAEEGEKLPLNFEVSHPISNVGARLKIDLPAPTMGKLKLSITYETSPKASGLQWLTPENTLGKKHPYLFSQFQAIHARSVVPCQDTPAVKFTFNAEVTHPPELTALLSGVRLSSENGKTLYEQTVPISSYLLSIACGDIVSRPLGKISKVWAEEAIVDQCAEEFSETDKYLEIAEEICGPYVWKVYDLLVLPPSFPFGGMEHPCITYVTPTLLAGDKSLATVVAHEIAHSWTGNLVTNQNWEHFWLNEGFTMFIEGKIAGRMFGPECRDFHAIQGLSELQDCLQGQLADTPKLTKLVPNLAGVNPDDTYSSVPYIKGQNFLRFLEDLFGGPAVFDPFIKFYLNKYKNRHLKSDQFKCTIFEFFCGRFGDVFNKIDWDMWFYAEGPLRIVPEYDNTWLDGVKKQVKIWTENPLETIKDHPDIDTNLHVWQLIEMLTQFVQNPLDIEITEDWISLLESTYGFVGTRNSAYLFALCRLYIKGRLTDRLNQVFNFVNSNFRMKYVRPIYRDLAKWPEAKPLAIENFKKVQSQMMQTCAQAVAKDLDLPSDG